jgi:alpha-beta hydrolase superfamily lysophospholipase
MMSQAGRIRAWEGLPDDLPLHLAAGGRDPATNRGAMVEDFTRHLKRAGFSNLVSRRYPEQRHDLVNGLNRDVIRRDFVEWLEALAGSTASP